ncbi:MAG: hypothetical protein IJZ54_00175 [Clostridia bacterium]|nr:hypothetical protein [Clostridia bacterium]
MDKSISHYKLRRRALMFAKGKHIILRKQNIISEATSFRQGRNIITILPTAMLYKQGKCCPEKIEAAYLLR